MPGRLVILDRYDRGTPAAYPRALVLFGDNLRRFGKAGQAVVRGHPNALGIPTKRYPSMRESSFLRDEDLEEIRPRIENAFARAEAHLLAGGDLVLPSAGFGTGLAELPRRAPRILAHIEERVARLRQFAAG